jgi:hydrogenase nickel incorporation protein HypB
MCRECGCEEAHHHHNQGHSHVHGSSHDAHPAPSGKRLMSVERKILSHNDEIAEVNRAWLAERAVIAVNLISAPGTGKTFLLERTLDRLRGRISCAVIAGDQKTDNDARRLSGKGAKVCQIETASACHLDAERIRQAMPQVVDGDTRLLFIENVGNLVCPAAFDLGENFKIALMSVTEGEDKPLKYPALFVQAPVVVLTKTDLLPHLDWSLTRCREYLRRVHPGVFVFELSAKTGDGMDTWIHYLERLVA